MKKNIDKRNIRKKLKNYLSKKKFFIKWFQNISNLEILKNIKNNKKNDLKETTINNTNNLINCILNIVTKKIKRQVFKNINIIYKLNCLEKAFNKFYIKLLKKDFMNKLKKLLIESNNNKSDDDIPIVKIKIILKKYTNNKEENKVNLYPYISYWVDIINKKNILYLLLNTLKLKKKNKEYNDLINKQKIISAFKKKHNEMNLINKKKMNLLTKIINIKNKCNNNIISQFFNKWKNDLPRNNNNKANNNDKTSTTKKKRIVKRINY